MVTPLRMGVLGARSMIARLALYSAIDESKHAELVAVSAASGPVPPHLTHLDAGTYDDLITDSSVEAVYIPLPNHLHKPWAIAAMRAGKHVLCEKPLARTSTEGREMFAVADETGMQLGEAWMTPFDPRWSTVVALASSGEIGKLESISGSFTFTIGPDAAANYRWDPDKGGGAAADVGIYCLGAVEALWGLEPDEIDASIVWSDVQAGASGPTDATTAATLRWADGRIATLRCSFVEPEQQRLEITGSLGSIVVDGDAFTGGTNAVAIDVVRDGRASAVSVEPDNLYRRMVDQFALAVREVEPWPRPSDATNAMAEMLARIRVAGTGSG